MKSGRIGVAVFAVVWAALLAVCFTGLTLNQAPGQCQQEPPA